MQVVSSTFHQVVKFPTPLGINEIRGERPAARDMSNLVVEPDEEKWGRSFTTIGASDQQELIDRSAK